MNPLVAVGSVAALVFTLAPPGSATALTRSGAAGGTPLLPTATVVAGNVTAIVPGTAITPSDGLASVLHRGEPYRAEFVIWVAPNAGKATLSLQAIGVTLSSCTSEHVRAGSTSRIMCLARGRTNTNASFDVVVRTSDLGTYSRTFVHALTG